MKNILLLAAFISAILSSFLAHAQTHTVHSGAPTGASCPECVPGTITTNIGLSTKATFNVNAIGSTACYAWGIPTSGMGGVSTNGTATSENPFNYVTVSTTVGTSNPNTGLVIFQANNVSIQAISTSGTQQNFTLTNVFLRVEFCANGQTTPSIPVLVSNNIIGVPLGQNVDVRMQITARAPSSIMAASPYSTTTDYPIYQLYNNLNTIIGNTLNVGVTIPASNSPTSTWYSRFPLPTASITTTGPVCIGAPLSYTLTGGTSPYTYSWGPSPGFLNVTNPASPIFQPTATLPISQIYGLTVTDDRQCKASASSSTIVVNSDPTIGTQPSTTQTVCVGGSAPLSVGSISGGGTSTISYQWYEAPSVSNFSTTTPVGTNSSSYAPPTTTAGTKYYFCIVSRADAGCSVTSTMATVIVVADPTLSAPSPAMQTICQNAPISALTVTPGGGIGTTTYQWFSDNDNNPGNGGGSSISGTNSATYTPPNNVAGTFYYYCVLTRNGGAGGCDNAVSSAATVIINPTPTVSNRTLSVCSGTPFNDIPTSSPPGATYTWGLPTGSGFSGGTGGMDQASITGTLINNTSGDVVANYVVTPKLGSCSGATFTLSVTVKPLPVPSIAISNEDSGIANDGLLCANTPITLTASATGAGGSYSYSWTIPGGSSTSNPIVITNATNANHGSYTVTVTAANACTASTSRSVTVYPLPSGGSIAPQSFCPGGSALSTVTGVSNATTYSWTLPPQLSGSSTTSSITLTGTVSGVYTVTVTPINATTANSCPGAIVTGTVTIKPVPTVSTVNNNPTICSGEDADITLSPLPANVGGTLFDWSRNNTINVTGDFSENNVSGPIIETLTNTTFVPQTVVFTITPKADGCPGTPVQVSVVVNPTPDMTISNNDTHICTGESTNITLTSNVSGATFDWTRTNGSVTGLTFENGNTGTIAIPLTNSTNINHTTVFTITPWANGCSGSDQNTMVNVGALPNITLPVSAGASTVCEGSGTTVTISTSQPDVTYQLRRSDNSPVVGAVVSGPGTGPKVINVPASALTVLGSPHTFNIWATTAAPYSCSAQLTNTVTITVHGNSTPPTSATVNGQPTITICPNAVANINLAAFGGFVGAGALVRWYSGGCASGPVIATGATVSIPPPAVTTTYFVNYSGSVCAPTTCASVTVVVSDTTLPTITCPAPVSVNTTPGVCSAVVVYSVTTSDNCSVASVDQLQGIGSAGTFPLGVTLNQFRVTDGSGNTATCSFTVTVTDNQAPVVQGSNGSGTVPCPANATLPSAPIALDNCDGTISGVLFSTVNSPSSFTCEGIRVYTFSYTDGASNVSYWTYTYTIERLPFTISTPNGTADVACPYETDTPPTLPTVTDHCGNVLTPSAPVISPIPVCEGDRTYTYTYTDCEGNSQNWVFTYTVIYDSFFGPSDDSMTVACPDDTDNNPPFPDVFDNCGNPLTPVLQNATAKPVCEGERTLTYLYSDCVGNEAEWNFTYYVVYEDFTPPAPGGSTVSCPNQTDTPPTLPTFTDNCGETLTPSAPVVSVKPACEGTRTYTYTLTDCAGFSHNWVYTYTIDYTGGLTPPANTTSTVSCPGAAVNPGAPANITDACGRTVSPVLIGSVQVPNPVTCEGTIVWTYRYTACDGTTTADWTHTYTIDYSGGLTPPANTTSTVSCPANAVNPGAPANITDACGRTISAALIGATHTPNPVTCEGTIVWTYRYTACDGTTTADWTHTYTIDYSGGLTPPANTTSTVSCPANAVNPGAPANILDACGRTVSAALIGATQTPDPVTCEGTIVWTYRYTACDGTTTADWTHTYTIDYSGGLTPPANTTSTVSCPANATNPGAPANITDACGRTVSAALIGATQTPDPVTCEGTIVWTYRYTACDGTTTADWTHTYTIDYSGGLTPPANTTSTVSCPGAAVNPGAPANITDACGRTVSPTLIGATHNPDPVTCEGTIVWTYRYTACDGTTTADWTHTYTIDYSGGLTPPANTTSTVSCPANAVNPGAPANITDACGRTVSATLIGATQTPDPVTCEGTIVWTYRYTACDGTTTADWTHTYTIDYSGGLTPPANTSSTVSCPANATNPGAPANITDACGRTVSPALIGSTHTPDPVTCEGTIVWTYRYTACDGTTTADWTHTYTIDYSGGLTPPTSTTSTVSCPANATNPGAPANITDACGRTVSATLIGATQTPDPVTCEGTIVWTYRYTACDGTTTADWTHTYTIDYSGGLTPPTSTTSTVSCPANATNPGAPANITDACGRTVSPTLIGATHNPDPVTCEGTIVWTYRYTACDGTTTADWTHTYTIERLDFSVPVNGSLTVDCAADATAPTLPEVTDNCGAVLTPTGPVMSGTYAGCEGTIIYTYTYTDCELNTHDWSFTYTIEVQDFTVPSDGTKTVACESEAVTPSLPDVESDCGLALPPSAPVMSGTYDGCEGTIIYTYTYTDCESNSHDWSYIYTIVPQDFELPANEGTTVSCPDATDTPPALPVVTDFCGNTLSPTGPPVISAKPACEGTRTYTYTYVDCDGNSHDWVYTYNVEREDFTMPANDGTTVACITMAIAPAAPAVTDNCGTPITPTGPAMGGTYDGCEGTRTYTYTYTDCEGTSHDWVYTYTIEREDFTVPAGGSSTVACIAMAIAPAAPAVTDNCGTSLTPTGPVTGGTYDGCEGTRTYTYTYTDCELNTHDWVYTYTIEREDFTVPGGGSSTVACIALATAPAAPAVTDNCGTPLTPTGPVTGGTYDGCEGTRTYTYTYTDCELNTHDWVYTYTIEREDFTVPAGGSSIVACQSLATPPLLPNVTDNCGTPLTPVGPSMSGTYDGCEGTIIYTYTYTDCELNVHNWTYTYTVELEDFTLPANSGSTVDCPNDTDTPPAVPTVLDYCNNVLTPSGPPVVSAKPVCEGTRTYTYTYTDCEGTSHNWIYTYTVEREDFTMPANDGTTVACITMAIAPAAPAVTDNCGTPLNPTGPAMGGTYDGCEGTRTYTFTYTDCELNTHDWVYTYTIEREDFTVPGGGSSTVACITMAIAPAAPAVTDNCGTSLTPTGPVTGGTYDGCEGTRTYTYTYTDCELNTHDWVYTYTIEREDFTVPAGGSSTVACIALATAPPAPAVTDNCGTPLIPTGPVTGGTYDGCEGTRTYTYTYTDCEETSHNWVYTYTIEREDFTMPANAGSTVACFDLATTPVPPAVTDNCGNPITPTGPVTGGTYDGCEGTRSYTYIYTDCEETSHIWVYTYTIELEDFTVPAGGSSTVACISMATAPAAPEVTDNCGEELILLDSPVTGGTYNGCEGTRTYTYTFTDCIGTSHDWVYTYTVEREDFTMPANDGTTVACITMAIAPAAPAVTDNCGTTLTPTGPAMGGTYDGCEGTRTYTYTYTDCEGTSHNWVYTYTIEREDFTMPANDGSTVACIAMAIAPVAPAVTDNCGTSLTPTGPVTGGTYDGCEGTRTYTYTYTDCEGTSHNWVYTYLIEVLDFTMPANDGSNVGCTNATNTPPTPPVVTDFCGNTLTPSAPVVSPIPACDGTRTYTYTYTDCEGTSHDWVYTYTINVTESPAIICPVDIVQLSDIGLCFATNVTIIPATSSQDCTVSAITGVRDDAQPLNAPYPIGTTTITWTATDACNHTSICEQSVTINNSNVLIAQCKNATVQLDATGSGILLPEDVDNGNTDACGNLTLSVSQTTFTCAHISTNPNTVILTVTDDQNNTSTCSAFVNVQDQVDPDANCQNITVQLDAAGNVTVAPAAINDNSTDACGIQSMSLSKTNFTCADISTNPNTVTLTVTDVNGNNGLCSATVTVQDLVLPNASCQNVIVQLNSAGNGIATAAAVNNGSSDACGIQSMSLSQTAFTCADISTNPNPVVLTVTDNNGNVNTCSATVTVQDLIPPVAVCQSITVQLNAGGTATIAPVQINNGSNDACGIAGMSLNNSNFTCANLGSNLVVLTVTDVNGNTSTCSAGVTVQDLIPPVAICMPATINLSNLGIATLSPSAVNNNSTDNCAITTMSVSQVTFNCTNIGANTVTLMVNDASGNTATCSSTVTVQDLVPPGALCKNAAVQLDGTGNAVLLASQVNNGSADNCGTPSVSVSPNTFTCANLGANTVTLTANDGNGNTSTCSATVTVQDQIAPVAQCQNVTVTLSGGTASITAGQVNNGSTDNCAVTGMSVSPSNFTCANVGNNTVTLTVSDAAGNTGTCNATVLVTPLISAIASSNSPVCAGGAIMLNASGGVSYNWSGPGGFNSTGQNPVRNAATTVMSGTYIVTVTNEAGCAAVVSTSVTVLASPTASITGSTNVCTGATIVLNASGGIQYEWSGPGGYSSTGISLNIPNASAANAGSYTVTVTAANGCTATSTVNVNILPPPVANATGSVNVCVGGTITLSATGGTGYQWSGPNSYSGFGANVSIIGASLAASGTYTVTVTNSSGCTNTASHTVTVNTPPTASASSNSPVCVGSTLTLFGNGGVTYAWSGPSSFTSNLQNPTRTPVVAGTYTVTVTNAAGCTHTASTSVSTIALPTATVTGSTSICAGTILSLTASGGVSYAWSGPNSFTGTGSVISITNASPVNSGTYVVTVTNAAGCQKTASRTVTVNPTPAATAGSNSPVCLGSTINLTSSGGTSYLWNGPGGYSSSAQNPVRSGATALMAGTYTVTVTGAGGCTATASTVVVVNSCGAPLVITSYVITKNSSMTLAGNGSILLNVSGGVPCTGGAYYTYAWSPATGSMSSSAGTHTYSGLSQGFYTVTITDCGGNSITQTFYVSNAIRGFKTGEATFGELTAYPNPISNEATITFTSYVAEHIRLAIYTVDGKEVGILFDGQTEENTEYVLKFNMSELPQATYYALLEAESGTSKTIRLVVFR